MLNDFVSLQPGDWVLQNAANSAVGRCVIQIARARGWKTINVVRRPELIEELKALGADEVLVAGEQTAKEIRAVAGQQPIRLALNAVGGDSALDQLKVLAPLGVQVTYGGMSKLPVTVPTGILIFNDVIVRGFWMTRWYENASAAAVQGMWSELAEWMQQGALKIPVERVFSLDEVAAAVALARKGERSGKVLLKLN
jgi:trans-2-enoyl-CoA reductase